MWLLQHAVAGAGIAMAGLPGYVKCVLAAVVAISAWIARPGRSAVLIAAADGTWCWPAESLTGLRLLPGSRFTRSWAQLRFEDAAGRRCVRRIWFDVFSDQDRRALLIRLRELQSRAG